MGAHPDLCPDTPSLVMSSTGLPLPRELLLRRQLAYQCRRTLWWKLAKVKLWLPLSRLVVVWEAVQSNHGYDMRTSCLPTNTALLLDYSNVNFLDLISVKCGHLIRWKWGVGVIVVI